MASVSDYTFYNLSRVGEDTCDKSQRNMQNSQFGTYNTTNHFSNECGMKSQIDFATNQPNVFYMGGHGGAGGCTINDESELKLGTIQNNPKCRVTLQERQFVTVPFLGRGAVDSVVESKLQQGDAISNRKSVTASSETSHIKYRHTPMIPSIESTITNPANLIEDAAADGWIRGGLPSRELAKDNRNNKN